MRPALLILWTCGLGHSHTTEVEAQMCIDAAGIGFRGLTGAVIPEGERLIEKLRADFARAETGPPRSAYTVHEAGWPARDGSQACARCDWPILRAAPPTADRSLWGFPIGRRIVKGPSCTYLVTLDRQLAPDEVPCT